MSAAEPAIRHPDAETIAALAEGRIEASKLEETLVHVETCKSCTIGLELASETLSREGTSGTSSSHYGWWSALAAAVLAILIGAPILWQRLSRPKTPTIANLVALAPRDARLVEPRLSGGFAWAPYRGAMRADSAKSSGSLRLGGAAADAIDHADRDATAESQHVAGVAVLLADDPLAGADRLRLACARAPGDARIASDLAAARYAAALALGRSSLYPEALAAADQALRIDAQLPEALFNRAMILERMGLAGEARHAWERYLAADLSSAWAEEARRRLAALPKTTSDTLFRNELPRLDRAAQSGDAVTVARIVHQYPLQSRTFGEAEYLGHWGEAILRGDGNEAARLLGVARALGSSLASESLLRDAVSAIDHAEPAQRISLARAHQMYRRGRMAYARQQLNDAERDLSASASLFEAGASPMSYMARFFVACVLYDRTEVPRARRALEELDNEAGAHAGYVALRAQTRWERALCAMYDNDWNEAAALLNDAEEGFARSGERANLAFVRSLLASALMSIGRPDDAWSRRIRAFEDLTAEGHGDRLLVGLSAAARMEQRAGKLDTAFALLTVEIEEARQAANGFILPDALVRGALLAEEHHDHGAAVRLLREASHAAGRIAEESLRNLSMANVRAAEGAVGLGDDAHHAIDSLTQAIDFYRQAKLPALLPAPYLYRARAELRAGMGDEAMRDLEMGIAGIEQRPVELAGPVVAAPVFESADTLFEDAVRLSLARGDRVRAFEYAERRRAQSSFRVAVSHPQTLQDLQRRLRGSATLVLHLTSLPDEVIAFAVSENEVAVARTPFARDRIERASPDELFDVLIRPSVTMIDRATDLIVVADPQFERVPFAALHDRTRKMFLIERVSVAIAPAAAILDVAKANVPGTIVAVALPTGEGEATRALPAAQDEIGEIAPLYRQARVLQPREATYAVLRDALQHGTVLHIAGHTMRDRDDTALRLAGGERATWAKIAADPIDPHAVVVLAACETLRGSTSPHVRSLSLGAAFVAAGAESAIGTLTPIADAEAGPLFLSIERYLAAGVRPAQAVRRAQLEAIASGRLPSWQAIAIFTRCIRAANPKEEPHWAKSSSSSPVSAFTLTKKTFLRSRPSIE
jgi:CHAT domain-containing protein